MKCKLIKLINQIVIVTIIATVLNQQWQVIIIGDFFVSAGYIDPKFFMGLKNTLTANLKGKPPNIIK